MKTAFFAATLLGACQPNYGDRPVHVTVRGTPPDAQVTVDDQLVGRLATIAKYGLRLRPGRHHVTVERSGYFPFDRAIDVDDSPLQLDVALTKIPE